MKNIVEYFKRNEFSYYEGLTEEEIQREEDRIQPLYFSDDFKSLYSQIDGHAIPIDYLFDQATIGPLCIVNNHYEEYSEDEDFEWPKGLFPFGSTHPEYKTLWVQLGAEPFMHSPVYSSKMVGSDIHFYLEFDSITSMTELLLDSNDLSDDANKDFLKLAAKKIPDRYLDENGKPRPSDKNFFKLSEKNSHPANWHPKMPSNGDTKDIKPQQKRIENRIMSSEFYVTLNFGYEDNEKHELLYQLFAINDMNTDYKLRYGASRDEEFIIISEKINLEDGRSVSKRFLNDIERILKESSFGGEWASETLSQGGNMHQAFFVGGGVGSVDVFNCVFDFLGKLDTSIEYNIVVESEEDY